MTDTHSLIIRRWAPAEPLNGLRVWDEEVPLAHDDERARRLLAREARRTLAQGGARLRATRLRYADGETDLVLVADRTAYDYETLRGVAGGAGPTVPASFATAEEDLIAATALTLARYGGTSAAALTLVDALRHTGLDIEVDEAGSVAALLEGVRAAPPTEPGMDRVGLLVSHSEDYLPMLSPPFPHTVHAIAGTVTCRRIDHVRAQLTSAEHLAQVSLLSGRETTEILAAGSTPVVDNAGPATILAAFRVTAARHRDRPALQDEHELLTYGELDRRSDERARGLHALGVRQGDLVGVRLAPSNELIVTLLAILKAGAAYVPLDPHNPPDRLEYIAADAGLKLVVDESTDLTAESDAALRQQAGADDPAYVIYTSGSTGHPKGVVVPHRNVCALIDATGMFRLTEQDVWTLFHTASFDFSVWEIWGCLLTGGRLVVVPYLVARSPAEFRDLLAREQVTVLSQTPSAFQNLIEADAGADAGLAVRLITLGGETLDVRILERWFERHPPSRCRVVNMYGITETTVHVTHKTITQADVTARTRSVGRALPGWSVSVRDTHGHVLPSGAVGEIYVGGAGVAAHYLGREELTARRFVPDPAGGGRVYRSGDQGRLLADGTLDHLGRLDHQVKVRGFRIELGEIEAVLRNDPGTETAAAVIDRDPADPYAATIAAFVVLRDGATTAQVRERAGRQLPGYMVPTRIIAMSSLPLTVNGKLDTGRLAELAATNRAVIDEPPAILPHLNATLLGIWRQVLAVPIAPDDDFFEIGGNSLLAVRLLAAIRQAGLPTITVRQLYANRSVTRLAATMSAPETT